MIYGSVCSGIEAATAAWEPLGWRAAWFTEIEPFCCALIQHHYPEVENRGDFTKIKESGEAIDLLVGGTPCQSFSIAGRRAGLDDSRGNLTIEYLALAGRLRPRWVVWENVPGILSIGGGRTFGTVLGLLGKLGYGFAYRILDAQYFGVAQRRRRVFVIGYLGDWRRAAAVLFERDCLSGDPAPRREAGERTAPTLEGRAGGGGLGTDFDRDGGPVAMSLNAHGGSGRMDGESETFVASPLTRNPYGDHKSRESLLVTHCLRADGFDASEDGTGRGTPIIVEQNNMASIPNLPSLRSCSTPNYAVAFTERTRADGRNFEYQEDLAYAVTNPGSGGRTHSRQIVKGMSVRRLTARECERLQGFPDDYTLVPYRGKPAADGPRYRAIGNSMAVPVMAWIGRRIQMVEEIETQCLSEAG